MIKAWLKDRKITIKVEKNLSKWEMERDTDYFLKDLDWTLHSYVRDEIVSKVAYKYSQEIEDKVKELLFNELDKEEHKINVSEEVKNRVREKFSDYLDRVF